MNFRHEGDPALYYGYEIFQVAAFRAGFWRMVRVSVPSDEQREVVSALSGVPRAKASRRTVQDPSRGTFDRGDLKEVAGSIRYGATINFLCNESLAVGLRSLHETNSALRYVATRPEDITPALAVAGGHFVQVPLGEVCHLARPAG